MLPSHHLSLDWATLLILQTDVSSEIGIGRTGGFCFDFKNAGFIFVYVSVRQLIVFTLAFDL